MAEHFDGFNAASGKNNPPAVPAEDQLEKTAEELAEEHNEAPENRSENLDETTESE